MWTYEQRTGVLRQNGQAVATGYSGHEAGKNNPQMQYVHQVGPIPRGKWTIGPVFDSETHGPVVMRLTPCPETNTYERDGFLIHGDSINHPGQASLGCIVLPRPVRLKIACSGDTELEVVWG